MNYFRSGQIETAIEELAGEWARCGVKKGDLLLLHSSASRTCRRYHERKIPLTPADMVESFLRAVGTDGTLLLPVFNYDFAKGVPYDIRTSPSQVGAISEAGRLDGRCVQTGNPSYSY